MAATIIAPDSLKQNFYYNQPVGSWSEIKLEDHMETAKEVLVEFSTILDKANIEHFLHFGTLLGYYRDNSLIPHDGDIDFGFLNTEVQKLVDIINTTLVEADYQFIRRDRGIFTFVKNAIPIDIYEYSKIDINNVFLNGNFYAHPALERGYNLFTLEVEPLKTVEFLGKKVQILGNTEAFLIRRYGNWKILADIFNNPL